MITGESIVGFRIALLLNVVAAFVIIGFATRLLVGDLRRGTSTLRSFLAWLRNIFDGLTGLG